MQDGGERRRRRRAGGTLSEVVEAVEREIHGKQEGKRGETKMSIEGKHKGERMEVITESISIGTDFCFPLHV